MTAKRPDVDYSMTIETFALATADAQSGGHPKIAILLAGIGDDRRRYLDLVGRA